MDQSLYIPLDKIDRTEIIVNDIKNNLNEKLINEMRYIIKEYNKKKKNKKDVGKLNKHMPRSGVSLLVSFN